LGHLNAKFFLLPDLRSPVCAPKPGIFRARYSAFFIGFRLTLRFLLFQNRASDSAASFVRRIYSVSAKEQTINPQPRKTAFLSPKNEEERAFRFRFSEALLVGLTVWPNDRNFIA
jgi:hypothetical protein